MILTEEDQVDPQVKRDAEWKLSPLLEDYHIWLDDVVDYPAMETETEPVDICRACRYLLYYRHHFRNTLSCHPYLRLE